MNTWQVKGKLVMLALAVAACVLIGWRLPMTVHADGPLTAADFALAAPQGFGDRQNSWAWSMQWWRGHLYVGTNRAYRCAEFVSLHEIAPGLFPYPPDDPDLECAADPADLPLQAEIWRWSLASGQWERVYQAPLTVPLPEQPDKLVARDIGYRGMAVFREADGTEALYVTAVSPQAVAFPGLDDVPPRILRSADGVNFAPVPQDPGTALANFPFASFRNPIVYQGRLYVIGGTVQGSGTLLEAARPELGNDSFQIVSPPDMMVSAVTSYNGHLYVGVRNLVNGYAVVKSDLSGAPPYTYTTVIERGGWLDVWRNVEVLSFQEFAGRLYVGGNGIIIGPVGIMGPAELVRINPDDSWDVVVGYPRDTPQGWKTPLSGLSAGFGNFLNGHMWQMTVYNGVLYVGTFDSSTTFKDDPVVGPTVADQMGFDLYATRDGVQFAPVTTTGFGDRFSFGVRTLEATPCGLFLGTANPYYGLQIWRAGQCRAYLPMVTSGPPVEAAAP